MTDPAVEAAWAACKAHPTPWTQADVEDIAISAAREALAPVRAWFEKWDGANPDEFDSDDLLDAMLQDVKPLIYGVGE